MYRVLFLLFLINLTSVRTIAQFDIAGSGRALSISGSNDYVDFGDRYHDLNLPFTVSAWVNLDPSFNSAAPIFVTADTWNGSVNIYRGFYFYYSKTNLLCDLGDGLGGNNPAFRRGKIATIQNFSGQWAHVCAVVRTPFDIDLYLNGVNVGGSSSGNSNQPMASSFPGDRAKAGRVIGNDGIHQTMKGMIDEIRLWNRALTESEVRGMMCRKLIGNETGLIGYWNFDETSGNTVVDKSANGFNGQLMNAPTRVYSGAPIGDESSFLYQANWTGIVRTQSEGSETVEVSNILGSPQGIHTYTVRSAPSQTAGLDVLPIPDTYFGVFMAATDLNNSFNVTHSKTVGYCGISRRLDNSISSWLDATSTITGVIDRTELISQAVAVDLEINLGEDEVMCPFVPKTLQPAGDPSGFSFTWQNGSTQSTFQANNFGTYWVIVEKDCISERDTITFSKAPQVDFYFDLGDDEFVCPLESKQLTPLSNPSGFDFTWQDGSNQSSFLVKEYGEYHVTIESECSIGSDTISILKPELGELIIPNVFTPNDDEWNQNFIIDDELIGSQLVVYNRWGRQVFTSSNYQNDWSAYDLPVGIYYYLIRSECADVQKGWLSIIR